MNDLPDPDTLAKLKALSNPKRLEIYTNLWLDGPADANKLGQQLNMDELSVYYHLRQLENSGLVQRNPKQGKTKATYGPADRFSFDSLNLDVLTNRQALITFVEAIIRAVSGEYSKSVDTLGTSVHDHTFVSRTAVRLSIEDQKELFDKLHELSAWIESKRNVAGDRMALTVIATPVN